VHSVKRKRGKGKRTYEKCLPIFIDPEHGRERRRGGCVCGYEGAVLGRDQEAADVVGM
jgi:hypothetical protein